MVQRLSSGSFWRDRAIASLTQVLRMPAPALRRVQSEPAPAARTNRSVVVHSKEAYVALYGKFLGMLATIRPGLVDPDMKAVTRMKAIAQQLTPTSSEGEASAPSREAMQQPGNHAPERVDSDAGSLSSGSEAPVDSLQGPGPVRVRSPFEGVRLQACWTHKIYPASHMF